MKPRIFAVCLCLLVFGIDRSVQAQGKAIRSSIPLAGSSTRDQDGLNGPVRRIRVETAKALVKDGKTVEAPRVLREVTSYDPKGRKIDSVAYPVESSTLPGKEQYQYDDKGNIVEMILRADDGTILSKQKYGYEFDELGNWKKMTSSVAVYENGELRYEPDEVTYRTITYYYSEAINKLAVSESKASHSSGSNSAVSVLPNAGSSTAVSGGDSTTGAKSGVKKESVVSPRVDPPLKISETKDPGPVATGARVNAAAENPTSKTGVGVGSVSNKDVIAPAVLSNPTTNTANSKKTDASGSVPNKDAAAATIVLNSPAADNAHSKTTGAASVPGKDVGSAAPGARVNPAAEDANSKTVTPAPVVAVKRVSEGVLRNAAIQLPQPVYSEAAMLARAEGNVQVQILVDEKGEVINARTVSGNTMLSDAAEAAARKSRFFPAKLSPDPARVYSVLNYNFALPSSGTSTTTTAAERPSTSSSPKPEETKSPSTPSAPGVASRTAAPPSPGSSAYNSGLTYLTEGRFPEAVEALKQAVQLDPNDPIAYVKLGTAYTRLHQYDEAVTVLKMAIRIKPEAVDAEAHYELGYAYAAAGRHSDALTAFTQALYITRAQVVDTEEAKAHKSPTLELIHYGLGLSYHNLQRYKEAINELKQVIKINPKIPEAYYALALDYVAIGDYLSAEKQEKVLSSLDPAMAKRVSDEIAGSRNRLRPPLCPNFLCR